MGRNPGKQPRAQGFSLKLVDDPELATAAGAGVVRRQVTDIAPATAMVTEHRSHRRRCGCGTVTTADARAGTAMAPASYGPNLRAWAVYLLVFQHIPVARVVEFVADL